MDKPANDNHPAALTRPQAADKKDKSFIYIIHSIEQDAFKVGYTSGTPRLPSLQTGNPTTMRLVRTIAAERQCEPAIHKALAAYRIRGEWFSDQGLMSWLLWELLDAKHSADQCGRLMLPKEAGEAAAEAIRVWKLPDVEEAA